MVFIEGPFDEQKGRWKVITYLKVVATGALFLLGGTLYFEFLNKQNFFLCILGLVLWALIPAVWMWKRKAKTGKKSRQNEGESGLPPR